MASAAPIESPSHAPGRVRVWASHLLSLYIPLNSLVFLLTGPHAWWLAPLWMVPLVLAHQLDCGPFQERRQPDDEVAAAPFDALVYLLAGLQFWAVFELARLFSVQGIFSLDMVMVFLIVGGSSGFSIITAHELIHRRGRFEQTLGRLVLCSVLYEHFYTEHLRGHHVRVGTPEDPATARFGESYPRFFRRTVPAQLRSAWRLEKRRLGDAEMALLDPRMLGNRILHGLVVEWGLALAILGVFGLAAFFAFLLQAFVAVRLLEAVNYFEHWGLSRRGMRVRPADSWDTHSTFTYYGLIGLSRHADHHAHPTRPYQGLRVFEEAPVLPYGYVGTIDLVIGQNDEFQRLAADELGRRRLGPFRPEDAAPAPPLDSDTARAALGEAQREQTPAPGPMARAWGGLPGWLRVAILLAGVLGVTTLGVQWEAPTDAMSFAPRLLLHAWILAVFALGIVVMRRLGARLGQEALAWTLGYTLVVAIGLATDWLLA